MPSGMAFVTVLLLAACVLCNQVVTSLIAVCLTFKVSAVKDFCCSSAAAVSPLYPSHWQSKTVQDTLGIIQDTLGKQQAVQRYRSVAVHQVAFCAYRLALQ